MHPMRPICVSLLSLVCLAHGVNAQTTHYVDVNSKHPVAPYTSWSTAATNIQNAITYSGYSGEVIWVNDGTYQYETVNDRGMSRLNTIGKPLTIQSVDGPAVTTIKGSTNSSNPIRCAYLTAGSVLSGFTLIGGGNSGIGGAGVYCETLNCIVTNCIIASNSTYFGGYGGGALGGTLLSCLLTNNSNSSGPGGGAASNTLVNCTFMGNRANTGGAVRGASLSSCLLVGNASLGSGGAEYCNLDTCTVSNNSGNIGGGLYYCIVTNSLISSNYAQNGGGVYGGALNNCIITGNSTGAGTGGGAEYGNLTNCLLVGNVAGYGAGAAFGSAVNCTITGNLAISSGYGGGIDQAQANNCIIYYNQAAHGSDVYSSTLNYCCTPLPPSINNVNPITNEPSFVDPSGDFHLQYDSPCINSGNNACLTNALDLAGDPRIAGGTVDIGAYEYQYPGSIISYAWLEEYGLPIDGSDDLNDDDGDGMTTSQEWIAGTDPTDPTSSLQMYSASPTNNFSAVNVSWQSVSGKTYLLQRSPDLATFATIKSNIVGQAGTTSVKDATATGNGPFFYRVAIQP